MVSRSCIAHRLVDEYCNEAGSHANRQKRRHRDNSSISSRTVLIPSSDENNPDPFAPSCGSDLPDRRIHPYRSHHRRAVLVCLLRRTTQRRRFCASRYLAGAGRHRRHRASDGTLCRVCVLRTRPACATALVTDGIGRDRGTLPPSCTGACSAGVHPSSTDHPVRNHCSTGLGNGWTGFRCRLFADQTHAGYFAGMNHPSTARPDVE